jgi:hypothetical protein
LEDRGDKCGSYALVEHQYESPERQLSRIEGLLINHKLNRQLSNASTSSSKALSDLRSLLDLWRSCINGYNKDQTK